MLLRLSGLDARPSMVPFSTSWDMLPAPVTMAKEPTIKVDTYQPRTISWVNYAFSINKVTGFILK
jgi:hypothetical protein